MPRELDEWWVSEAIAAYRRSEVVQSVLAAQLARVEVAVCSAGRQVEVRVAADGVIRGVQVTGVAGSGDAELSAALASTLGAAGAAASWARRTLLAEALAAVSPDPPLPPPSPPPPPAPPSPAPI